MPTVHVGTLSSIWIQFQKLGGTALHSFVHGATLALSGVSTHSSSIELFFEGVLHTADSCSQPKKQFSRLAGVFSLSSVAAE